MKKWSGLIGMLMLLCSAQTLWAGWRPQGSDLNNTSGYYASWPKTAVFNNVPYVVWEEHDAAYTNNYIYVKYWDGSAWVRLGSGAINTNKGYQPSIAIGQDGTIYVAYYEIDGSSVKHIYVRRWSGSAWVLVGSELRYNTSQHYAHHPVISIDATLVGARPQVAWFEEVAGDPNMGKLYSSSWSGSAWGTPVTVTATNAVSIYGIPSASSTGPRYIAYTDNTSDNAYVKTYNAFTSSWTTVGTLLNVNAGSLAMGPRIIRSSAGVLYATWLEIAGASDRKIYVKRLNGSTWELVGTTYLNQNATGLAEYPSIALKGEAPYVSWVENEQAYLRHWDGANWVFDTGHIGSSNSTYFDHTEIMFVSSVPYIAFSQSQTAGETYLDVYNWFDGLSRVIPEYGLSGKSVSQTWFSENITVPSMYLNAPGQTDVTGQSVVTNNALSHSATFNLDGVAPGTYNLKAITQNNVRLLKNAFQVMTTYPATHVWRFTDIGTAGSPSTGGLTGRLVIADPDQTGSRNLYVANLDRMPYEISKVNVSWQVNALTMGTASELCTSLVMADSDGDQYPELYCGLSNNHLIRYKNPGWGRSDLGYGNTTGTPKFYAIANADFSGDGIAEIYVGGDTDSAPHGRLFQFLNINSSTWIKSPLPGCPDSPVYGLATGDGNNDGVLEMYSANADGKVYQYKYNGTSWTITTTGTSDGAAMDSVAVGDGDNDGKMEVYTTCQDGKLYQFRYALSAWTVQTLGTTAPQALHGVAVSDGDSNGTSEIYATCENGHAYQYQGQAAQWTVKDLGGTGTSLHALAVGDADNDNRYEVYALGGNSHVYQFQLSAPIPTATPTVTATPTPRPVPETFFKVFKNQIDPTVGEQAVVRWSQPQTGNVTIKIYNLLGDKVATLADNQSFAKGQFNELKWNGRNSNGNIVASGIYIVDFLSDNHKARGKIAVVK